MSKKRLTCNSLQTAIYLAPEEIRTCCKRYHIENEMKGDAVVITKPSRKISLNDIYSAKNKIIDEINSPLFDKSHQCYGCPWLREVDEDDQGLETTHISIEHTSVCNMRCSYCSDTYYGGKRAKYEVLELIKQVEKEKDKEIKVVFGGGEPVLDKDFEILLEYAVNKLKASIRVFTNGTIYSNKLNDFINTGQISITTSIDAGNEKVFEKVRGLKAYNKVWNNLTKYAEHKPKNVFIKYIFTEENSDEEQIRLFLENVKSRKLNKCSFQISSDFKEEALTDEQIESIRIMRRGLNDLNVENIVLDDHLAPRLLSKEENRILIESEKKFIVWGAGEQAKRIFERYGVEKVMFFVDSKRHGKTLLGKPIYRPEKIWDREEMIYIASVQGYNEIAEQIKSSGCSKRIINK